MNKTNKNENKIDKVNAIILLILTMCLTPLGLILGDMSVMILGLWSFDVLIIILVVKTSNQSSTTNCPSCDSDLVQEEGHEFGDPDGEETGIIVHFHCIDCGQDFLKDGTKLVKHSETSLVEKDETLEESIDFLLNHPKLKIGKVDPRLKEEK